MQRRGRDRAVSEAAKARLKSQERLRPPTRRPAPPCRAPHLRSPPRLFLRAHLPPVLLLPPLTLSDQVHIAYADDDIHLAKVLLLRLQGIEVTSDSDPRIAAVKDEDFDACFIPFGRLDDGRGEQSAHLIPQPTSKQVPDATARRAEALKAKERLWETEARRFTEERCKYAALKRRTDTQRAVSIEQERVRLVKQKEAAAAALDLRRRRMKPMARTLNFALVPPVSTPPQKFTYDFPFTPRTIATPRAPTTAPPPAPMPVPRRSPNRESQQPPRQDSPPHEHGPDRVTFAQVLASMQGDLFPVLPCERTPTVSRSADRTKARRQLALLDALLVAGVDLERDFNGKGKGRALNDNENPQPCACLAGRAPSPASPIYILHLLLGPLATGTSATSVSVGTVASFLGLCIYYSLVLPRGFAAADQVPVAKAEHGDVAPRRAKDHVTFAYAVFAPVSMPTSLYTQRMCGRWSLDMGGVSAEWDQDAETDKETEEYIHAGYKEEWEREKEMQRKKDRERRFDFQPPPPPLVSSIEDDPLAPLALLSPAGPAFQRAHVHTPPRRRRLSPRAPPTPSSSRHRNPYHGVRGHQRGGARRRLDGRGELGVLCGEDEIDGGGDSEDEGEGELHLYARLPAIRVRAVPNSAFLRVKALHNEALPLLHQHLAADATAKLPVQEPAQPRRPRECVVGTGVDYAPGSGLRFVYARAAAVAG
ncbi:hypothetical protein MVEN_01504700 [Mycena venus]|uniref:Uncharacterized protein n=1 Tax=Mycena venus TaxID=2733690 RepID=A0A8H7CRG5_9AGAR|nr:hypothetical protein MVEN_01504700 [Mycena venus]